MVLLWVLTLYLKKKGLEANLIKKEVWKFLKRFPECPTLPFTFRNTWFCKGVLVTAWSWWHRGTSLFISRRSISLSSSFSWNVNKEVITTPMKFHLLNLKYLYTLIIYPQSGYLWHHHQHQARIRALPVLRKLAHLKQASNPLQQKPGRKEKHHYVRRMSSRQLVRNTLMDNFHTEFKK